VTRYKPTETVYFVEPASSLHATRYHILEGRTVVKTQSSRPDGVEVPKPAGVRWDIRRPQVDLTPEQRSVLTVLRHSPPLGTNPSLDLRVKVRRLRGARAQRRKRSAP
jgi:hypothetical protein